MKQLCYDSDLTSQEWQQIEQLLPAHRQISLSEAVNHFITEFQKNRPVLIQKARGLWKDRQDLPAL